MKKKKNKQNPEKTPFKTNEHLQTYIEEIEASNEELQSLNEELQSTNEELQSSNEELKTTNEELQSINEEIQIAYAELKSANEDQERYRSVFENSLAALFITDEDGNIVETNEMAETLFQYSDEEFMDLKSNKLIDPVASDIRQILEEREKTGRVKGEVSAVRKNGEKFSCEFSSTTFTDLNGNKLNSLMLFDISDRKTAEAALKETNKKLADYKYAIDESSLVVRTDAKGTIIEVNDYTCEITGYSREELIGENSRINKSEFHADSFYEGLWKTISAGDIWRGEIKNRAKDGSHYWVDTTIVPFLDEEGLPYQYLALRFDITRQKKEEQQLRLMESVVTNTKDAVLITEAEPQDAPDGPKIVYANEAFEKMTGYQSEEIIGKTPRILQGPESDYEELSEMGKALRKWEPYEVETINYKKNGEEFWINFSVSPIANETGRYTHWISVERDVTDRKNREIQKSILADIADAFNQPAALPDILENVLAMIYDIGHFPVAEVWLTDTNTSEIKMVTSFAESEDMKVFYEYSKDIVSFQKGTGLPGKTWKSGKMQFWKNLDKRKTFKRRKAAQKAGLKTAYGLPITHNKEVIGVLVFGHVEKIKQHRYYVPILEEIGVWLGAEIKRKQFENELNRIFSSAPDIISVAGFDGYFKKVNPAMSELLGYTQEELLSTPILEFVHPEDKEKTKERTENGYKSIKKNGEKHYFENRYISKTGQVVWFAWTANVYHDEELFYAVAKDVTLQKELEKLLKQSNRLAKIGSWELDLIKNDLYWSEMTREIHEVDADFEPDLETAIHFYKEGESRKKISIATDRAIEDGTPWDVELQIVTAKGNERWVRAIGESEMVDGECTRLYGSFQDIHIRKIAEERLKIKSRHIDAISRLNSALLNYRDWYKALNENLEVIGRAVNSDRVYYFENYFDSESGEGYTSQKLEWCRKGIEPQLNNPDLDVVPFKEVPELVNPMIEGQPSMAVLSEVPEGSTTKYVMEDEGIKAFMAIPITIKGEFQGFVGFDNCSSERYWSDDEISFLKTISLNLASAIENEDAELALQRAYDEKNEILESIGDGFFAVNRDWTVTYWNNMAEEILGRNREEVLGENLWEKYEEAISLEFYSQYHKAMKEDVIVHFEEYFPPLQMWIEVSAYPSDAGLSVFFKNITDRKLAEEKMKELNKELEEHARELAVSNAELEQFAFVASHDLQEPLRMVTSFLTQLERKYSDQLDEKGKKYIYFATDGAKRMRQIILDLLEFSRTGIENEDRSDVDVGEILGEIIKLNKKTIEETGASITWEEMPVVHAARVPLQQIFQNLILNGLKYQVEGNKPIVNIRCTETKTHWMFSVKDNGIGIESRYKEKIFNIFQRLHNRDEYSGTGMGLAICKKIVEHHDGEIWVDSKEHEGSTFYFTIVKPPITESGMIE